MTFLLLPNYREVGFFLIYFLLGNVGIIKVAQCNFVSGLAPFFLRTPVRGAFMPASLVQLGGKSLD